MILYHLLIATGKLLLQGLVLLLVRFYSGIYLHVELIYLLLQVGYFPITSLRFELPLVKFIVLHNSIIFDLTLLFDVPINKKCVSQAGCFRYEGLVRLEQHGVLHIIAVEWLHHTLDAQQLMRWHVDVHYLCLVQLASECNWLTLDLLLAGLADVLPDSSCEFEFFSTGKTVDFTLVVG